MQIKKLLAEEVPLIHSCLLGLAEHHNSIEGSFSGIYPTHTLDERMKDTQEKLRGGDAVLYAVMEDDKAVGCMFALVDGGVGTLAILYVDKRLRGKGYGDALMQKALDFFKEKGVTLIDINVVAGNNAKSFYEKHGFSLRQYVMSKRTGE
ncbi:GNAT family N-acetyltransferase [Christensenellaceae bacterium OttesenSCG-928-K19]|nr:GNAT family N-acetyltransferase [Christensenellaceae bacterium OttesenSCG-928-K19]